MVGYSWHSVCLPSSGTTAVEQDPVAAARAAQSILNVISMQYVEELQGSMLIEFLRRCSVEGMTIGGGSSCKANSFLNRHRNGFGDARSHQPCELVRIVVRWKVSLPRAA